MGLVRPDHILRCTVADQRVQHGADASVMGSGGQLAVGEGARPALAKLDVGYGVQTAAAPETLHVPGAFFHRTATLQHDGRKTGPGQKQGGKQARRAHAHHHGRVRQPDLYFRKYVVLRGVQGRLFPVRTPQYRLLMVHRHIHGVHVVNIAFIAGVNGLPGHGNGPDLSRANIQHPGRPLFQLFHIPIQWQGHVAHPDHSPHLANYCIQSNTKRQKRKAADQTACGFPSIIR